MQNTKFEEESLMKILKFIKPLENYALDDVASFEDKIADKVVEAGYATEVTLESTKISTKDTKDKK